MLSLSFFFSAKDSLILILDFLLTFFVPDSCNFVINYCLITGALPVTLVLECTGFEGTLCSPMVMVCAVRNCQKMLVPPIFISVRFLQVYYTLLVLCRVTLLVLCYVVYTKHMTKLIQTRTEPWRNKLVFIEYFHVKGSNFVLKNYLVIQYISTFFNKIWLIAKGAVETELVREWCYKQLDWFTVYWLSDWIFVPYLFRRY